MKFIPNAVSIKAGRAALKMQKHSPAILFGAGVVGMVGTAVSASRATLKLEDVLAETDAQLKKVELASNSESYSEEDAKRDTIIIRTQGVMAVVKLYAPSVALGCLSIAALTGSHVILSRRNAALASAYAVLEKGFNEYRQRVEEEFGSEKEREIRYGSEVVKTKDENGKQKTEKFVAPHANSIYARFFDQLCSSWSPTPEYNLVFLKAQQTYMNQLLNARGHVFLNEVYDCLGIPRSKAGAVVGWIISDEGDNYIDFNIFNSNREAARDFVNGREGAILLDFNVDGVIYDKI